MQIGIKIKSKQMTTGGLGVKDKKAFTRKIGDFLAGKGFYVVLIVCTAVIGISAWILLSTGNNLGTKDADSIVSTSQSDQEVMVSSDYNVSDIPIVDVLEKPATSAKPSDAGNTSAEPSANKAENKASTEDEGKSEPAMAKQQTFVWPIVGDIEVVYSVDELIYSKTMADWRTHDGIDIEGIIGTKVVAVTDGTVIDVVSDDMIGTAIIIDHGNGLKSIYANLAKTPVVKKGDKVAMGAVIGAVGDTALAETSEVAHLHFAMTKDNDPVDPSKFLPKR